MMNVRPCNSARRVVAKDYKDVGFLAGLIDKTAAGINTWVHDICISDPLSQV
jgi:hypothetical protein